MVKSDGKTHNRYVYKYIPRFYEHVLRSEKSGMHFYRYCSLHGEILKHFRKKRISLI